MHLGTHKLAPGLPDETEVRLNIAYRFIHYQYERNDTSAGYDIALLKLDGKVTFSDAIKPICMPFGLPELNMNSICFTTGWGRYNQSKLTNIELSIRAFDDTGTCKTYQLSCSNV